MWIGTTVHDLGEKKLCRPGGDRANTLTKEWLCEGIGSSFEFQENFDNVYRGSWEDATAGYRASFPGKARLHRQSEMLLLFRLRNTTCCKRLGQVAGIKSCVVMMDERGLSHAV